MDSASSQFTYNSQGENGWVIINKQLQTLQFLLDQQYPCKTYHPNSWKLMETPTSRASLAQTLDFLAEAACNIKEKKCPFNFRIVERREWDNIEYYPQIGIILREASKLKTRKICNVRINRFIALMIRLSTMLKSNIYQTKRKLFYADKNFYSKSQSRLDCIIEDLAASLRIPRASFHITPQSKGLVCGKMQIAVANEDEETGIKTITTQELRWNMDSSMINNPANIVEIKSDAKFCLVLEKEAVYYELLNSGVHKKFNCIVITGKGVPDISTRYFVNLIWQFLRIPIFCLVDGDPHGIEIMCVYRFGSLSTAYDNQNLACPPMRWLGMFPSDLLHERFKADFECIAVDDGEEDTLNDDNDDENDDDDGDDDDNLSIKTATTDEEEEEEDELTKEKEDMCFTNIKLKAQAFTRGLETLTDREKSLLLGILRRPYVQVNDELRNEIQTMLHIDVKIGLEFLTEVGLNYLWDWYLPRKLEEGRFV